MSPIDDQQGTRIEAAAANLQNKVSTKMGDFRRALALKAALLGVLGLCILFWPGASMKLLAQMVGLFCLIDGVTTMVSGSKASSRQQVQTEASVSLLIGVVLLIWPASATVLLLLFGALMAYTGMRQILFSRGLPADDPARRTVRTIGIVATLVGLVLLLWPKAGVVSLAWVIGIATLLLASLLGFLASRLKQTGARIGTMNH